MAKPSTWSRIRGFFSRMFERKPPEPGRFESDTKFAWRGVLATVPWLMPRREYLVYIPQGRSRWRRSPLLVLIHGCRQQPEEFAAGTRITRLADEMGCFVLLPRQAEPANPWRCWNWYDSATVKGWGETAIVAAQIRAVRRAYRIDRKRVFVAGMSSGGALAVAITLRRPDLVAGAFVHSAIACGASSTPAMALQVTTQGADTDVVRIGEAARAEAEPRSLPVRLMVVQGERDTTVAPINAVQVLRQMLAFNSHPAAVAGKQDALPPPDQVRPEITADGRSLTISEWSLAGRIVASHVSVAELGHAWSGGDDQYPYNDPRGPDASAMLAAFMRGR